MPLREILVVPHSHTDLGFTHDRPVVKALHGRFLDRAMDLVEADAHHAQGERMVWVIETYGVLLPWLRRAGSAAIERLQRLERAGLIEVMAWRDHQTPLADLADTVATLRTLDDLRRDYGFRIECAMNCDVNGVNWPVADALLDAGVRGYTTAINQHFGKAPLHRPSLFRWQAPSGRTLSSYVGMAYGYTGKLGIGAPDFSVLEGWLPRLEARLAEGGYPASVVMFQSIAAFGDNGPADASILPFIRRWNAEGRVPRLRMGTMRDWWDAVAAEGSDLPVIGGDWTDSWNFGAGSKARELAYQRGTRGRLRAAEWLLAVQPMESSRSVLEAARDAYHEYHEHTWSADSCVGAPWSVDAWAQDTHKSALAATAHSLTNLVLRDAVADLARRVERSSAGDVLVVNPLPFARTVSALVPGSVSHPRGIAEDMDAARHFADRKADFELDAQAGRPLNEWHQDPEFYLRPVEVPAFGFRVVPRGDALVDPFAEFVDSDEVVIETQHGRFEFDAVQGGVRSWRDNATETEWVDQDAPYRFHELVHERVGGNPEWPRGEIFTMDWASPEFDSPNGWRPGWRAERTPGGRVQHHRVRRTPLGVTVRQVREASGIEGLITQTVFLPAHADWVEFTTRYRLGVDSWPQAHYVALPFAFPGATARIDVGPMAVQPSTQQIPGVQADYFTVQGWVDFATSDLGVTIATPLNPLVQLGRLRFGDDSSRFEDGPAHFYGWVSNNYWETNFPAVQPGDVIARYRVCLRHAGFDEAKAHRFGLDAAVGPVLHHLGEPIAPVQDLPAQGSLLEWPAHPALLPLRTERRGSQVWALVQNASDGTVDGIAARRAQWRVLRTPTP